MRLVQVPANFGEVFQHYHYGQSDPIYTVTSRFVAGMGQWASDQGLEYKEEDGDRIFVSVSDNEIRAIREVSKKIINMDFDAYESQEEYDNHFYVAEQVLEWWPDLGEEDD